MRFYFILAVAAALLDILLGWHGWPAVLHGNLNDPDSYMRLERIYEGVRQGHLVNIVARDDSGQGVMVEWSRLLDALLWLMALPLVPWLGWHQALLVAGIAWGPLSGGLLAAACAFTAEPFVNRGFLWSCAAAVILLPGLHTFAAPGVVHYHILLLIMISLCAAFTARAWQGGDRLHAFLAGISGGLAIWTTPETMPFILMIFAALMIRWWMQKSGGIIAVTAAGFFDAIGLAFTFDPPQGGWGVLEVDRLSLVYVVLAAVLLLGGLCLWRLDTRPKSLWNRTLGLAVMAVLLGGWVLAFPQVAMGPYGLMSAEDYKRFFGVMLELQPLRAPEQIVSFLLPGLVALCYALLRGVEARHLTARLVWLYIALCTLITLLLADRFILFVEFPAAVAAIIIALMLQDAATRFQQAPLHAMRARLASLTVMFVLPTILPALILAFWPATASPSNKAVSGGDECGFTGIAALLAPAAGKVVMAPAEDSPALLFKTQIETVGSLYQHGVPGFLRLADAWNAAPGNQPPAAVTATLASYVLFCGKEPNNPTLTGTPANTLWSALAHGQPPAWLRQTASNSQTGWVLYQVIPPPAPRS